MSSIYAKRHIRMALFSFAPKNNNIETISTKMWGRTFPQLVEDFCFSCVLSIKKSIKILCNPMEFQKAIFIKFCFKKVT